METVIQLIWATGLVVALVLTLVILKEVALVLRALRHILYLAERTRDAARGIGDNTQVISQLPTLAAPAVRLQTAAVELAGASKEVERRLQMVGTKRGR